MADRTETELGRPAPWLVGVVNVTPDSFTDGGQFLTAEAAIAHGRDLAATGADLVEIGGEATGPGTQPLTAKAELQRIEPVLAALSGSLPVAIDTYHRATAARGLALGARAINDVSALRAEPELARVVAEHAALLVLMHAKDGPLPHVTEAPARYVDVTGEVAAFLLRRAELAVAAGIATDRIVLDPGGGRFLSHDPGDSWRLLAEFERFVHLVRPFRVMVATSRKGFLGVPMAERDPVSQLTALVAATRGASFIRTHEVAMAHQFVTAGRRLGMALGPAAGS